MVSKAYQTLTDPAAKENIEKYGNPDGYQGVSVTIGLPSILTRKENEMPIMLLYESQPLEQCWAALWLSCVSMFFVFAPFLGLIEGHQEIAIGLLVSLLRLKCSFCD